MVKYLAFALILFSITSSNGQSSTWTIGVKPGIGLGGINSTIQEDNETSNKYRHSVNLSAGIRVNYRISKYLSVNLDGEWQRIRDRRTRVSEVTGLVDGLGPFIFTTNFRNSFQRLQIPLALHFCPFPEKSNVYIINGIMPSLIINGKIVFKTSNTRSTGITDSGKLNADFDIPANKGIERGLIYFAGFGIPLAKRFSVELIYQFNKPIQYSTFDPGNTFVLVPVYPIRANQGFMFSVITRL
ncbi:outer membrane beta-barrel protein [Dyadobacter sp. NIV53]|uniref:outer membrane beta-barrel protein n=1 Tax=Dyadobacter sp. NIV53 TaxID=2861765 RepID=UPI001C88D45B|nr:outer membrane beta-barrel protein [Dyadobacter sp. NIV53]